MTPPQEEATALRADLRHSAPASPRHAPRARPHLNGHGRPEVTLVPVEESSIYRVLAPIYALCAVIYLSWRLAAINWHAWYGPAFFVAELFGVFINLCFFITSRRIYVPQWMPPLRGASVDVFVPTYNEPIEVLRKTVIGALRVRGVQHVFVLDDGNRPEVHAMAARLGARYIARSRNEHAKAGNLNHALEFSTAEFLLMLDADHIPAPQFLERTLGYFADSDLAFVQSPQSFYNHDSFVFRRRRGRRDWSEQGIFYDVIQPAKNRYNAAFFVGTSAVIRRKALDSIGGFATQTATEDVHTSVRMHARGWKSLLVAEPLAFGLEAESLREYYRQRLRWAAGSLGLLFRSADSPLWVPGLSLGQRINYVSTTLAHLQGIQRLFLWMLPVACIIYGAPVTTVGFAFIPVFLVFTALSFSCAAIFSRGAFHPLYSESYNLVNAAAQFIGLRGVVRIERKFSVSRKRGAHADRTWVRLALFALLGTAALALIRAGAILAGADWSHLRSRESVALASVPFLLFGCAHLLSFLVNLRRYEQAHHGHHVPDPDEIVALASARSPALGGPARAPRTGRAVVLAPEAAPAL